MAKLITGQVSVTAAAAPLTTALLENKFLVLKALASNAAPVFFGDSTVTTATGHALDAGETFDFDSESGEGKANLDVQPQDVYVIGTAGTKVTWVSAGK